ncbi:DNA mismatch repair protein [Diaporthe eres]|uniref:DNA mismatch repair protein n=1 Tax=Diaporthe eres TaxID=83184 RepID=A0ABR1PC05_DIAER
MSIKPLPADVVAQIKSSVVITSLNNVICGLIKNSLDAEATKINLSVDYSRGNCSVEDNGAGIPPSEFRDDGGLGQLHYGYVCREPVATKRVQFISLGIEPLSNESRCNVLFEEVNRVFADSAFGAVDTESDSDGGLKEPKMEGFTGKELKLKKGIS